MKASAIEKHGNWTTLLYKTTWNNGWETVQCYTKEIFKILENTEILVSSLENIGSNNKIKIDSTDDIFKVSEGELLTIKGVNTIFDNQPFQFTIYNQSDVILVEVTNDYIDKIADTEGKQLHIFDKLMDSIEILGRINEVLRNTK
jgi:hypothetical protein